MSTSTTPRARRYFDGLSGLFVVQAGHGREELAAAAAEQARKLAFFPIWSYAHPTAIELADRLAAGGARRHQQGVLLLRRRRVGGDRLEGRQAVLQADRQADQVQGDQPGHRLPRHHPGRPVDHRRAAVQGGVRAAGPGHREGAQHQLLPGAGIRRRRREGVRPVGGRPGRGGHPDGGPGHGGRGVRRAGAERRRLLPAAARLLRPAAGDLRHLRRAAGLRRGDLRLRPARHHVRRAEVRLPARHHHHRQGPHLRLLAAGRGDDLRPDLRAVRQGRHHVRPRLHVRRPSGVLRGRAGQPRPVRARGPARQRAAQRERLPADPGAALRPADRRRRPRRRLLLRHRAGQGQGDQGDVQRRRVRAGAARIRVPRAVRGRAVLPGRRPRRPRRPGRPAADLRPGRVRRDGEHSAIGARQRRGRRSDRGARFHGCPSTPLPARSSLRKLLSTNG